MEYSSSRSRHHHDHDHHHRRRRSRSRSKERSRSRRRSEDRDRDEKRRNERRKDDKKKEDKEDKEIKKVGVKTGESSMSARERMKARIQQQLDKAKVDLKDIKANEVKRKETRDSQDEDEDVRQERRVHILSYDQMVIRDERINEINSHAFKPQTFVSSRDKCKQVDIDEIPLPPTF